MARLSLRARLVGLTVLVSVAAVVLVTLVSYSSLRHSLLDRADKQVTDASQSTTVECAQQITPGKAGQMATLCDPDSIVQRQQQQALARISAAQKQDVARARERQQQQRAQRAAAGPPDRHRPGSQAPPPPPPGNQVSATERAIDSTPPPKQGKPTSLPPGSWIALLGSDGTVLGQIRQVGLGSPAETSDVTIPSWVASRAGAGPTTETIDGRNVRLLVVPADGGRSVAIAALLQEQDQTLSSLIRIDTVVGAIAVLLALVAAAVVVTFALRDLRRMARRADAIVAHDDLSARLPGEKAPGEVRQLTTALNAMLARIQTLFDERRATEAKLRRFVADASHELRTPITAIRGRAELLVRNSEQLTDDQREEGLQRIERQSIHLGRLVDELLDLARLDDELEVPTELVDLAQIAQVSVETAGEIDPTRTYSLTSAGDTTLVASPTRMSRVIDNLLANVRTHTPEGTEATVNVSETSVNGGPGVEIRVCDDGPGIAEADMEHAFERFWRSAQTRATESRGTGLGLSLVASIAAAHGGRASVAPGADGTGLCVTVLLPR